MTNRTEIEAPDQLTARVVRIPLPLPLADLHTVNCYAIVGDRGVALIDPGWATPENEKTLTAALASLGVEPGDVEKTLVTHHHWDHIAQAAVWQREHGIPLHLGREEHHSLDAFAATGEPYGTQLDQVRRAGAPEIAAAMAELPWEPYEEGIEVGAADVWLTDGQDIDCGGHTIIARHTPGHTRGHMVFHDPLDDLLFTGDHILPRITPAIALETDPEELPLRSYLASLQLFVDRPDGRMLPAHGAVTESTRARAEELLEHHRERLDVIADLVGAGFHTGAGIAREMRWTRRLQTVDELGPIHGMTAVSEVVAHLDLLADQARVVKDDSADLITYEAR
ncbi:MAG: hypothetical protein QOH68_2816 [Nocardioidaceae bacterium]|jgi:glyoxylase-like metal-dependent hydrolase (beta-lactamase superfamily II)|nr:hypothetical protein [Nocardioidaceae bacterium]